MKTLIKFVCCALLIFGNFSPASGAVYSTSDTTMRFSYCLIENMGSTPFFSEEDRNAMAAVAGMMAKTMQDARGRFSLKPVSIGFITSIAGIVLNDPRRKDVRKTIYVRALEQCSVASTGYVDSEFIIEALRIMSVMENTRASMRFPNEFRGGGEIPSRFRPTSSIHESQVSRIFDPLTVQPTPVQNRFVPGGFATYQTTNFQVPESLHHFSSSADESKSNINFPIPGQAANNAKSSSSTYENDHSEIVGTSSIVSDSQTSETRTEISTDTLSPHPPIQFRNIPNVHELPIRDFPEPSAVEPSPVQNPSIPGGLGVHDKTVSEVPESSFDFTSSEPNLQLPVPNERNVDSLNSDRTLESSGSSADIVVSPVPSHGEMTPPLFENPQSPAIFEGLSIPQTKESMVFVIPPKDLPQSEENTPDQEELVPQAENVPVEFPRDKINSQKNSGDVNPSESLLEIDSFNVSTSSALESIISDILTNSPSFRNAFSSVKTQEDAQRLARTITIQTLYGYNSELIEEAMTTVSNSVAKVTVSSPENYALALSEALASVLKLHNIQLFVDEVSTTSSIQTDLDTKQNLYQQVNSTEEISDDATMGESQTLFKEQHLPRNFQPPVLSAEDVAGKQFSDNLSQYLEGSLKLSKLFCGSNNITNKIQAYYNLINSSMSVYGAQISTLAASIISETLIKLPEVSLCSAYPRVISDIISEILYENGRLQVAKPEELLKQMEFNIRFLQTEATQTQQPEADSSEGDGILQKDTTSEFDKVIPNLQSSYPHEPATSLDRDLPLADVDELSRLSPSSGDPSLIQQQYRKDIAKSNQDSVSESSDSMPISPGNEQDHQDQQYESPNNSSILTTTPFSIEISEATFNDTVVLTDTLTSLSDVSPKDEYLSDNSKINEEELATYLLEEMELVLEALKNKQVNQEPTTNPSGSIVETTGDKLSNKELTPKHSESVAITGTYILGDQEPMVNPSESIGETAAVLPDKQTDIAKSNKFYDQEPTANHGESIFKTALDIGDQGPNVNPSESVGETPTVLLNKQTEVVITDELHDQEPTPNHSESVTKTSIDLDDQEPTTIYIKNVGETEKVLTDKQTEIVESESKRKATTRPRNNYPNRRGHRKHKTSTSEVDSESNLTILHPPNHDVNKTDIPDQLTGLNSDRQTQEFSGSVKKDLSSSSDSTSATISNVPSVNLQPKFRGSQSSDMSSSGRMFPPAIYGGDINNPLLTVAKLLSEMASSTIAIIRSVNFDINELCGKLNEFAAVVHMPPVVRCTLVPVIDYLMHILLFITTLKGV